MDRKRVFGLFLSSFLLMGAALWLVAFPGAVGAATITYTGTVTYQGAYSGDTLWVAVVDTAVAGHDVDLLDIKGYAVGAPPLSQPYTLVFDNTGRPASLIVASFLDVDGGGVQDISGADVFGWYGEGTSPAAVFSGTSQTGLDFALPQAEIHGTVTMASGQDSARVIINPDAQCAGGAFRPQIDVGAPGTYAIRGVYPGTWCVDAVGYIPGYNDVRVCHGDPDCSNPTLVTLTATQVRTGVNLDFSGFVPARPTSWGGLKIRYP